MKHECPNCHSTDDLRYVQKVIEYHKFELNQFPSEDGFIDLVSLIDTEVDTLFRCRVVCFNCGRAYNLDGTPFIEK